MIVQTCRSWTSTTPSTDAIACPTARASIAGRRALEEDADRLAQNAGRAREHEHADQQAGDRVGVLPAGREHDHARRRRRRPRRRGRRARAATPPARSGSEPAPRSTRSAARLTTRPAAPAASTQPPSTAGGSQSRIDRRDEDPEPEHDEQRRRSRAPRGSPRGASRSSARASRDGSASQAAKSARPSASASESMCAASASSASEPAASPATASTPAKPSTSASAIAIARGAPARVASKSCRCVTPSVRHAPDGSEAQVCGPSPWGDVNWKQHEPARGRDKEGTTHETPSVVRGMPSSRSASSSWPPAAAAATTRKARTRNDRRSDSGGEQVSGRHHGLGDGHRGREARRARQGLHGRRTPTSRST